MQTKNKIFLILFCFTFFIGKTVALSRLYVNQNELDSILEKQRANQKQTLKNSIASYKTILEEKHPNTDSVEIFKIIALSSSKLGNENDAVFYLEKYIKNSQNISIFNNDSFNTIKRSEAFKELKNKYLPKVNFSIFFYFNIAFLGIFVALVILFRRNSTDKLANGLISGFIIIHSLFIIEFCYFLSNYQFKFPHTFLMSASASFLYGPLLFLYLKRLTHNYKFRKIDLLHFLPMPIILLILSPFYSLGGNEKLKILLGVSEIYKLDDFFYLIFIPKVTSLAIYGVFIGRLHFRNKNKDLIKQNSQIYLWEKNIYRIHIVYLFSYIIYGLSISKIFIVVPDLVYHSQVVAMSFMVLYVAQMAYMQPRIFSGEVYLKPSILDISTKYQKSGLTESLSEELKENLIKLLEEDKIYKNNSLSLNELSEMLGASRHNTSQIINEQFNVNFFELINKFRINEAINIFKEDINGNLNIIDVAYEVGYNNKVTFNKAFKKETSVTPSEFINSNSFKYIGKA